MRRLFENILTYHEKHAFGVCTWLGDKLSIRTENIRLSFIYLSFITFGSPIFLYLIAAFILRHKDNFLPPKKPSTIWEL
ncbi:MAG: PspC domain-containing protein [Flavobacteriales bacterium]|nr:PspC domain-containing protein [Flavobacteriales bacterium]NNK81240.1 PspC domain-containing protein [Flavobacteriales bacterium]